MSITLNVPQYSVTEDTVYWNDLFEEHKNLPMLCIGRDSYIEETQGGSQSGSGSVVQCPGGTLFFYCKRYQDDH